MSTILGRIREVEVQNILYCTYTLVWQINMIEYERGGAQSPPLQTAVDTEQIRNVQDSERYAIHISGTKII